MVLDVDRALRVYLGSGNTGGYQPIGCCDRLRLEYPTDHEAVMEAISPYLEFDHPPQHWTANTLSGEAVKVAEILRKKHPELSEITIRALANMWSYDWK